MALYTCTRCGQLDNTGWTFYWIWVGYGLPPLCAVCEPIQRCHWHNEQEAAREESATQGKRRAKKP